MSIRPLTIREKIAYGLGDMGCNFVWQTVMLFLAYYYTDVYGLSPAHMGTMFLLVRFVDAITDPLMGSLVDRTETRWGRFRPYLAWFAVPFGLACMVTFYTPDMGQTGKIVYAYAFYIFLTIMYTAINVPYCAMANALSSDPQERTSLQSFRFALGTAAGLIVALVALPLVKLIGGGNEQVGYFGAMSVMGVIAIALFFISFANTKERVAPTQQAKGSVAKDLKLLLANSQWRVLFVLNLVLLVGVVLKGASTMYYVNSVLGRADLATAFMVAGMAANIIGALVSAPLLARFDKVQAYKVIIVVSGLLSAVLYLVNPANLTLVFTLHITLCLVQMMSTPLLWSMMSDVVDYERSRSGRSLEGMVFSTALFAIKAGIAIGGALVGWILAGSGYVGGAETQTPEALRWITMLFTVIPGVCYVLLGGIMSFYKLDTQALKSIASKLNAEPVAA
ncbi:glycoside-pentoside-hexuronide (GPH):cation symporter [Aliagarivorans marinus]|uniref:glycoside-pentoside-hexuronide (GPH):cation symporter n=1 Tax=Aliagarivorans marinus TaxID=561965 RepID=UPI00041469B5|nr:glycoside-pentoside-hexuronide (GPH):cation symporter [Aliagarivorans marinus]